MGLQAGIQPYVIVYGRARITGRGNRDAVVLGTTTLSPRVLLRAWPLVR